jgi:hypothetical protein
MMTTAEKLYQVTKGLPEPILAELLDFAEFLSQRNLPKEGVAEHLPLLNLKGGLESSITFADDALVIQKRMRDEWN